MGKARGGKRYSANEIADGIRKELRSILKMRLELCTPIDRFEPVVSAHDGESRHYVIFQSGRKPGFKGLLLGGLKVFTAPDERIHDAVLEFSKAVWHLKDRLIRFARIRGSSINFEEIAQQSNELLVASDLSNQKKHGGNDNRSGLDPYLSEVSFDTSNSGMVEIYYDGAIKEKGLIVSNPVPIPFSIDILANNGDQNLGDARIVLNSAFGHWLPTIRSLGVIAGDDPEERVLRESLFDEERRPPSL